MLGLQSLRRLRRCSWPLCRSLHRSVRQRRFDRRLRKGMGNRMEILPLRQRDAADRQKSSRRPELHPSWTLFSNHPRDFLWASGAMGHRPGQFDRKLEKHATGRNCSKADKPHYRVSIDRQKRATKLFLPIWLDRGLRSLHFRDSKNAGGHSTQSPTLREDEVHHKPFVRSPCPDTSIPPTPVGRRISHTELPYRPQKRAASAAHPAASSHGVTMTPTFFKKSIGPFSLCGYVSPRDAIRRDPFLFAPW